MATRSRIGILREDGSIDVHYCHSDGYFSWNGRLLHNHWTDPAQIEKLIELGDMSLLGEVIGGKQDFNSPKAGVCLFYKRDRHPDDDSYDPSHHYSIDAFMASNEAEEFLYLWDTRRGAWLGCRTEAAGTAADLNWHLLSDLASLDWDDGYGDEGTTAPVVQLRVYEPVAMADGIDPPIDEEDELLARAIF